jgi:hypothetical protein
VINIVLDQKKNPANYKKRHEEKDMARLAKSVGSRQYGVYSWFFNIYISKKSSAFFYDLVLDPYTDLH